MSSEPPPSAPAAAQEATVLVRGETVKNEDSKPAEGGSPPETKPQAPPEELSAEKVTMKDRLPRLADDPDVGIEKDQIVVRDGKADLAFTGTLLASVAPPSAPNGQWQEYRVYETTGRKHVFTKVSRNVLAATADTHEAEVFDPSPASVSSKLIRSARDLTRQEPLTWMDAAASFFGYDPLAKSLYRKLSARFEEHIS
jgi:hypothetical protein